MRHLIILSLSLLFSSSLWAFDYVKGVIEQRDGSFYVVNSEVALKIITTDKISKSLPSLHKPSFVTQSNGKPYTFEFKGTIKGDDSFELYQVPTNIPGSVSVSGTLMSGFEQDQYIVDGKLAKFGYTKNLNGYEFDKVSKDYLLGEEVLAEGDYDEDGLLVIQAITPLNLLKATEANPAPIEIQDLLSEKSAKDVILKEIIKNKYSQKLDSFRLTLDTKISTPVETGDSALIITLGGRQGDSFGSVNGHYVAGLAEVTDDLSLRGEVSNAYVTNGKDILSGNTSLTNYFSHTVQGQNNYRPTYTLIAYGVDKAKLKEFRDALEESHIAFRTQKLSITPQFNCTTETVKALKNADFKGKYNQAGNTVLGVMTRLATLPLWGETAQSLQFAIQNDPSRYHPRSAFNSFVKAFLDEKRQKKYGIKRLDYVFYQQIPSNRPIGGMALGKVFKANKFLKLYKKYEVKKKLTPEELRPILEDKLQVIPYLKKSNRN